MTVTLDQIRNAKRDLAAEILRRRKRLGWSQLQLARASGLSEKFIGELERGQENPSLESLVKLADGFGAEIAFTKLFK